MATKIKGTGIEDGTVTAADIAADGVAADEIAANAVGASEIATGAVGTDEIANGSVALADLAAEAVPVFTKSYQSGDLAISAGGTHTLTHGLGAAAKLIRATLKCATAEAGYSVGDEVEMTHAGDGIDNRGMAIVGGASSILVRFGTATAVFMVNNKTTGAVTGITNGNWRLVVRAWA